MPKKVKAKIKAKRKPPKKLIFRLRDGDDGKTSCWLIEQEGPARSGRLHGVMFTDAAEAIAKVLARAGILIEHDQTISPATPTE